MVGRFALSYYWKLDCFQADIVLREVKEQHKQAMVTNHSSRCLK